MILKNKNAEEIYKTNHKTLKATLTHCAKKGINLQGLCIRNAKLTKACLDGLNAPNGVFWGCDFRESDIGYANLTGVDFRACDFEDVCFAGSDLRRANMRGAYFGGAILDNARLDGIQISCPSFWDCDVFLAASGKNMIFSYKGEQDLVLNTIPLILQYKNHPIILMEGHCYWRGTLFPKGFLNHTLVRELFDAKVTIERILAQTPSQDAKKTYA